MFLSAVILRGRSNSSIAIAYKLLGRFPKARERSCLLLILVSWILSRYGWSLIYLENLYKHVNILFWNLVKNVTLFKFEFGVPNSKLFRCW